jgi:penicillin-binding protein 1C
LFLPKPALTDGIDYSRVIFDRHHKLLRIALTKDEKYRIYTPLSAISPELINATLFHEDRYYRVHPGVNPVAIARSAWTFLRDGRARAGASTVTMQLARLRFHLRTRTLAGKCEQIVRALEIERHYTKAQILEAYFNLAPYGGNLEGIGAASARYFGKPPLQLTMPEAVALSVIPQSPARRAPYRDRDNPALTAAQNRLFDQFAPGSSAKSFRARVLVSHPYLAPHFTRQATRETGSRREVVTTLELDLQRLLERRIEEFVATNRERGIRNAASMLVDTRSMETLAEVGSADYFDNTICGQVDGTRCKRSPGSTLKPFIYALALDQGLIHPLSILADAPHSFGSYNPENFDREYVGPLSATEALVRSRNIPAITLASQLSHPTLYEFLKSAGVELPREESFYGLSLPLGGAEVTMRDLIKLYAALENGGRLRQLHETLPHASEAGSRLLSPEAAFLTLEMLGQNARPSQGSNDANEPVHWKTGTSNGFHDAWSVAVFGPYALAVWVGNFDGRSNPAFVGRTCAGPLLFQIVDALRASAGIHWTRQQPPPGANLQRVEFCAVSGQLPGADCPDKVSGWFIPGISPIATCGVHRAVLVDAATGLRVAADDGTRSLRREVCEFWPSNLLELFAKAGLPRRLPPPFLPGYEGEATARPTAKSKPLRIISPKEGVTYAVRVGDDESRSITLKAEADADVAQIYWFADKAFLGVTRGQEPLHWQPQPRSYTVVALDDHGRSDSITVTVMRE